MRNIPHRAKPIDNTSKSKLGKQILIWGLRFSKRCCWGFTSYGMWRRAVWSVVYDVSIKGSGFETSAAIHLPEGLNPQARKYQWRLTFHKSPVNGMERHYKRHAAAWHWSALPLTNPELILFYSYYNCAFVGWFTNNKEYTVHVLKKSSLNYCWIQFWVNVLKPSCSCTYHQL